MSVPVPSPSPTPATGSAAAPTAGESAAGAEVRPPPFWIWPALSITIALLLAAGLWAFSKLHRASPSPPTAPFDPNQVTFKIVDGDGQPGTPLPDLTVPDFAFTERSGRTVTRQDLQGQVWVADFIFTHCTGTCPVMTSSLKSVQEACKDLNGLRLVSFTVDPERDTPERLTNYAESQGADRERWLFLTGEQQALYAFAREAFKLAVGEGRSDPETAIGETFIHSTRLVLVDERGRVVGMYSGIDKASVQALVAELRRRLTPTPDGSAGSTPALRSSAPVSSPTPAAPALAPAPASAPAPAPALAPSTHPATAPAP